MNFTWDYFKLIFPALSQGLTEEIWAYYAEIAKALIPSGCSDKNRAMMLLNTVAHLLKIKDQSPGRISGASQGSVSVSSEYTDNTRSSAWWNQTQEGALVWKFLKRCLMVPRYYGARPKGWN